MSDTFNYNSGHPFGMGGFFGGNCGGFGGCNNWMDLIALVVVGGLFGGFNGWGGGFGNRGFMPGGQVAADATAATTAALISQQNTADRVAAIGADVRQVLGQTGGIIEAVNTVGNRAQDGFARMETNLCQLGNNIAMQSVNNYNGLTNQLTEIRFANQQCCCDTKQLIQSSFCNLSHQLQSDKCETLAAVNAQGEATRAMLRDMETRKLQEELAAAKAQLSQNAQTAQIVAAVNANRSGCCGGTDNCCVQNPCTVLTNALYTDWVNKTLNPTTTAAAA